MFPVVDKLSSLQGSNHILSSFRRDNMGAFLSCCGRVDQESTDIAQCPLVQGLEARLVQLEEDNGLLVEELASVNHRLRTAIGENMRFKLLNSRTGHHCHVLQKRLNRRS